MKFQDSPVLVPYSQRMDREKRNFLVGQKGRVIWFTGLSGSGKSTIAHALEAVLLQDGHFVTVLDGDSVRLGLCEGLGFSLEDRTENLRRVAHVARLMADAGMVVLAAFVSPLNAQRELVKEIVQPLPFELVHVDTSLEMCESRDPKGLYKKARSGVLTDFTGVSSPYEKPEGRYLSLDGSKSCASWLDKLLDESYRTA